MRRPKHLELGCWAPGSAGIVYPSMRHASRNCIVCFRPPLVLNVQEGPLVTFTFIDAKVSR
jgi:hypothetical protein